MESMKDRRSFIKALFAAPVVAAAAPTIAEKIISVPVQHIPPASPLTRQQKEAAAELDEMEARHARDAEEYARRFPNGSL